MSNNASLTLRQYHEAIERGKNAPRAIGFSYNARTRTVKIELANHTVLSLSVDLLPDLKNATAAQIKKARLMFDGADIWWDEIDVQHTVEYIAAQATGIITAREAARQAARSTSPAKSAAARKNGLRGGRPKKLTSPSRKVSA